MSGHMIVERRALPPPFVGHPSGNPRSRTRNAPQRVGYPVPSRPSSRRPADEPSLTPQQLAAIADAHPALRPTTYAPDGTAATARHSTARHSTAGRSPASHPDTPARAATALPVVALAGFLLLVLALVVPSSVGLPLAGAGFLGLVAARVYGSIIGWPARVPRARPARSGASG